MSRLTLLPQKIAALALVLITLPSSYAMQAPQATQDSKVGFAVVHTGQAGLTPEGALVSGGNWFNLRHLAQNAVLIRHPKGDVMIDAGLGSKIDEQFASNSFVMRQLFAYEQLNPAINQFEQAAYNAQNVTKIIPTHLHWDHASGLVDFPGAQVWVQQAEYEEARGGHAPAHLRASAADDTLPDSTCNALDGGQDDTPGNAICKADELAVFLAAFPDVILVRLTRVQGSAPRGQGTTMCVSATVLCGTIGGGQLEYMAIDQARALLARGDACTEMDVPLGPEIGQCCGGRVTLSLTRMEDADRAALLQEEHDARDAEPHVYLYGAGHVGRALARAFAPLPLRL
uniref:XdhC family protein n=1 Tax=Candidatus Halocynthiibacter alkanivorans TaxID=2267619 RepID=UPI000DF4C09E